MNTPDKNRHMLTPANLPIRQLAFACLTILLAMIFIGGEQPGAGALFLPPWDKVVHVMVYGSIAIMVGLAFPRWSLLAVLLIVVGIGVLDEFHQAFLPGREAGLPDLIADFLGGLLALPMLVGLRRRFSPGYLFLPRR